MDTSTAAALTLPPPAQTPAPPVPPALPDWLTVAEAARYWRVSAKAVYADIRAGAIRVRRIGRVLRIPRAELTAAEVELPAGRSRGGR